MTRCHYGREDLAPNDALPVVGVDGAYTCAFHALMRTQNTRAGELVMLVLSLAESARTDPREFARGTLDHVITGGNMCCLFAELLLIGRRLNASELTAVVNEFLELGKREDAELRTKETTEHGHYRNH